MTPPDLRLIYESGQRTEAFRLAKERRAQHPGDEVAGEICVDYLFHMGRFEDCTDEARRVVAHQPKALKIWLAMAQAYGFTAEYDKAAACLQEAIAYLPEETILRNHLGIIYRMAGRTKDALEVFRECARRDPGGKWNEYNMLWGFLYEPGDYAAETFAGLCEEHG
ncbi:MAG: hypothetical protein SFW62_06020 [Alphaproteobacteria bacterium]|nr:hypothetical protein [Alphaproteobacteria bacterium]